MTQLINKYDFRRLPAVQFTFELWRAGSLNELGIRHREGTIFVQRFRIRNMAIGYTEGYNLQVRPKPDFIAVMFHDENLKHFWTHLTYKEFLICFPELENSFRNIIE